MREFLFRLFVMLEIFRQDSEGTDPFIKPVDPFLVKCWCFFGSTEVFHLHLLEFARAKDEIAGCHFVSKCLSDLCDPERQLSAGCVEYVGEIDKNTLGRLGPKVCKCGRIIVA